jgi:hypothetical protein
MPLGLQTTKVSTREELLKSPVVSGSGAPTHKPEIAAQDYRDTSDTAVYYAWVAGAWTSAKQVVDV